MDKNDTNIYTEAEAFASSPLSDYSDIFFDILVGRDGQGFAVRNELSLIAAPKKSGKSHVCSFIVGAALGGPPEDCLGFVGKGKPLKVVWLDAEQQKNSINVLARYSQRVAGMDEKKPDMHLKTFSGRGKKADVLRASIPLLLKKWAPDILLIDGVAKLVRNINDYDECSSVVAELLKYAEDHKCSIIVVIHFNPSSNKERGHLGTELGNETYGYLSLRRQNGVVVGSSVGGTRGGEFKDFTMQWDKSINTFSLVQGSAAHLGRPRDVEDDQTKLEYIRKLFIDEGPEVRYNRIVDAICKKFDIDKKNATEAKRVVTLAIAESIITKKDTRKTSPYILTDNNDDDENEAGTLF